MPSSSRPIVGRSAWSKPCSSSMTSPSGSAVSFSAADRHRRQLRPRRDDALEHVVVVAVHRVPRRRQPRRRKRPCRRVQNPGRRGEPVLRPRVVVLAPLRRAVGMPVADVVGRRIARVDALPAPPRARIRVDFAAVEHGEVGAQLVGLAGVRGVPGGHRELRAEAVHRPHHRLDDLGGEHLVRPVGADQRQVRAVRRVRIGVALQVLDPARRLRVHHVQVGQVREPREEPPRPRGRGGREVLTYDVRSSRRGNQPLVTLFVRDTPVERVHSGLFGGEQHRAGAEADRRRRARLQLGRVHARQVGEHRGAIG